MSSSLLPWRILSAVVTTHLPFLAAEPSPFQIQGTKLFQASPYERQIHLCLPSNQSRCLAWQWRATKQWRRWSAENNLEMNRDSWLKVTGPQDWIHTVLFLLIDSQLWLFFFLREGPSSINNTESSIKNAHHGDSVRKICKVGFKKEF